MFSLGCNFLRVLSHKQIGAHIKYFQIKSHVQTAHECHDLNMNFHSIDNVFKQLCISNFMQEYTFLAKMRPDLLCALSSAYVAW